MEAEDQQKEVNTNDGDFEVNIEAGREEVVGVQEVGEESNGDADTGSGSESDKGEGDGGTKFRKRKRNDINATAAPRSIYWKHYEKYICSEENIQKGKCKYCARIIKADPIRHGTGSLQKHFLKCKKKPGKVSRNQPRVAFQLSAGDGTKDAQLIAWKFDQNKVSLTMRELMD